MTVSLIKLGNLIEMRHEDIRAKVAELHIVEFTWLRF